MAFDLPITQPLTKSQAELTSKIGSMKNLLTLPFQLDFNIPKAQQMSTFDYLLKVMESLGISPQPIFNAFLSKIFDATENFLEEKVIFAISDAIGEKGIDLSSNISISTATTQQKSLFKQNNRTHLQALIPATFLQTFKQQMAKDLTIMIFGPKNGPSLILNPNPAETDRLVNQAICGEKLYTVSNDTFDRNEDLEYNRVALKKQLESGQVTYEISCQTVKISLPESPLFIFEGGGQFTQPGNLPPTPSQSLATLTQYVSNQVQNINNESNANTISKSFLQILIEKLIGYIPILVQPFLSTIFSSVNSVPVGASLNVNNVVYSACDILDDPNNTEKKEFSYSLCNALLKELLKMLLLLIIREFTKLVENYFKRTALEKAKRRLDKLKAQFDVFFSALGEAADTATKAQKYFAALQSLSSILQT